MKIMCAHVHMLQTKSISKDQAHASCAWFVPGLKTYIRLSEITMYVYLPISHNHFTNHHLIMAFVVLYHHRVLTD